MSYVETLMNDELSNTKSDIKKIAKDVNFSIVPVIIGAVFLLVIAGFVGMATSSVETQTAEQKAQQIEQVQNWVVQNKQAMNSHIIK